MTCSTARTARRPSAVGRSRPGAAWVSDGLGMLVEQAAAAFAIWRGRRPDARAVLRALPAESGRVAVPPAWSRLRVRGVRPQEFFS